MKGLFGAVLVGFSVACIHSNADKWWLIYAGVLLLLLGIDLIIDEKIASAIEKLEDKVYDK
jgi:hypothetical protein